GFSHARCSSKIRTLCPDRASCSPHIAPEGPPPTIAISDMFVSRWQLRSPQSCANSSGKSLSCDGEDRQAKTAHEYSTEDRCRRGRSCFSPCHIHAQTLQHAEESKIWREEKQENFTALQKKDSAE